MVVGDLIDHTPTEIGWASELYYNPYGDWRNLLLMPALVWASIYAIASGPWETIVYSIRNGLLDDNYSKYVLMQIKAMFWGPIQIVYYIFRSMVFIALIPYNLFVFFLDVNFLGWILFNWFVYYL